MKTIWKFDLVVTDEQDVIMPKGSEPLSAQMQHGTLRLWCLVDSDQPMTPRRIFIHGTGHPAPRNHADYVDTFQMAGGGLVFHVFVERQ